ncbi:S24 family peptidase [Ensifer sp. MPMI2T]|nr:S24 family peptidase [Ensifer sp. MPMI2T]
MSKETPASRLREARMKANFASASAAARRIGAKVATYTAHENGGRDFGREEALFYAKHFKVDPAWLMFGTQPASAANGPEHPEGAVIRELSLHPGEYEAKFDAHGEIDPSSAVDHWVMPENFLAGRLRVRASDAWVMDYQGDAMYNPSDPSSPGSIFPGDRAIVDTADRRPTPPGPFVIHDGTGILIKMLEVVPMTDPVKVRVTCRNPLYAAYELPMKELRIIGRVRGKISGI